MSLSPIITVTVYDVSALPTWLTGAPLNTLVNVPNSQIFEPYIGLPLNTRLPQTDLLTSMGLTVNGLSAVKRQLSSNPDDYAVGAASNNSWVNLLGYSGMAVDLDGNWMVYGPGGGAGCNNINALWMFPTLVESGAFTMPVLPSHIRYHNNESFPGPSYGAEYSVSYSQSGTSVTWSSALLDSTLVANGGTAYIISKYPNLGDDGVRFLRYVSSGNGTLHGSRADAVSGANPLSRSFSGLIWFYPAGVPERGDTEALRDGKRTAAHNYHACQWNSKLGPSGRLRVLGTKSPWVTDQGAWSGTWSWAPGEDTLRKDEETSLVIGGWHPTCAVDQLTGTEWAIGSYQLGMACKPLNQAWQAAPGWTSQLAQNLTLDKATMCVANKTVGGTKNFLLICCEDPSLQPEVTPRWFTWDIDTQTKQVLTPTGPHAAEIGFGRDCGVTYNPHLDEFYYMGSNGNYKVFVLKIIGTTISITALFSNTDVDYAHWDISGFYNRIQYVSKARATLLHGGSWVPMKYFKRQ